MSEGFVHSVKVPRIYKVAAHIVRRVKEDGASLKNLIYEKKHPNVSGIYALSLNTLQANSQLDLLLEKTHILAEQPRLDPWLAKVLITELLWGKKYLNNSSKPIQTILSYADQLQKEAENVKNLNKFSTESTKVRNPRYVRVNTLLLSVEKAICLFKEEGWCLLPKSATYSSHLQSLSQLSEPYFLQDFHIPEVLAFPSSTSFYNHAGYLNGELILQDKASCMSGHLLNPSKGSVVLDLCAAPGMKTTHLAAKLQNSGKIYAVEIDEQRFETLCKQIEITQSVCVKPLHQDALTLNNKQCKDVQYILVDPSCSGSGIINRVMLSDKDGKDDPDRLRNLQSIQVYLLRHALLNFPSVERVIYSTCSIHPEENEQVIDEILADIGDAYRLIPIRDLLKDNWMNFSSQKYKCSDKCLYSRPNVDLCNGFFVAVFERNFNISLPEFKRKIGNVNILEQTVSNVEQEKTLHKRKKRGKRKKKEISTIDEQIQENKKLLEDDSESEKIEIIYEKRNVCSELNCDQATDEAIILLNEGISEIPKDAKSKKSKKRKRSKCNDTFAEVNEMVEIGNIDETKQDEETEVEPLRKKKKKKKKENSNNLNQ